MKVLVTGSSGAVGKSLVSATHELIFVNSTDANLLDIDATRHLIHKTQPASIIHLAALSGGMQLSLQRPADLLVQNSMMATNLVGAAREAGINRIGFALSGAAYGNSTTELSRESDLHKNEILESDFAYGYAKRFMEILMRSANTQYSMDIFSFVINGVIGPNMNYDPEKAIVVASLVKRIYDARENSDPIVVWGDGSPRRQYTWAPDLSRNIFWCLENQIASSVLNIGTNQIVNIRQVATLICKEFEVNPERLFFDASLGSSKMNQLTDNSKFKHLTGFEFCSFEYSLSQLCQEYATSRE